MARDGNAPMTCAAHACRGMTNLDEGYSTKKFSNCLLRLIDHHHGRDLERVDQIKYRLLDLRGRNTEMMEVTVQNVMLR